MNTKTNIHFRQLIRTAVMLLVMTGWSLSIYAEDKIIFSMTNPTGPENVAAQASADLQATFKGGSAIVYNAKDRERTMVQGGYVNLSGSGNSYLKISLSLTCLLEGDVISIEGNGSSFVPAQSGGTAMTFPHTVTKTDAFLGSKDFYFRKDNNSNQINSVTITRPAATTTIESCEAKWDWKKSEPSTVEGVSIKNTIGTIASNVEGIYLIADAQSGEISDNGDNLKMSNGTELKIPVSNGGIIEFYFHAHESTWTKAHINGSADGLTAQTVQYAITAADLERGYVSLSATATVYLYSVTLKHRYFRDFALELSKKNASAPFFPNSANNSTYYLKIDADNNSTYETEKPDIHNGSFFFAGYNGDEHGFQNMKAQIPVTPGTYTITIGNCTSAGPYSIKSSDGTINVEVNASANCYSGDKETTATSQKIIVRNTTELTITYAQNKAIYTPYFAMSRTELPVGEEVNVTISPEGSGTVKGAGEKYPQGSTVTLTAEPEYGYEFVKWMDGETQLSTANPYSFPMGAEALNYTAVFNPITMYDVTLVSNPEGAGKLTTAHSKYAPNASVTVTQQSNTGYSFKNWTDKDGKVVATTSSYTFTMPENSVTLTANYELKYKVEFTAGNAEGIAPPVQYVDNSGTSSLVIPTNQTLYKEGYTLTAWTDGTNTYPIGESVVVTDNLTLSPVFTENTVTLADITKETTVTWQFGQRNGAPALNLGSNSTGYLVTQVEVNGTIIDIPLYIETKGGKFVVRTDDLAQVNSGSVYTISAFEGSTVKIGSYGKSNTPDTKVGSVVVTKPTETSYPYYHTAIVQKEDISDSKIKLTIGKDVGSYLSSVTVTYPAQKKPSDLKIALGKENLTLNLGTDYPLTLNTDYYTSSTGAVSFESSIPAVAEVNSESGVITPKGYGKTVITVCQAGDSDYASGSISFAVKVISPAGQTQKPEVNIASDGMVTITATEGTVYYTTDGTTPDSKSTEYTAPFSAQGLVVKAIALSDTKSPSDIVTAYVNVGGTFTWEWNKSGMLQTLPTITGNVRDIVDENTKAVIGKKLTSGFVDGNGIKGVSVTPNGSSSVVYTPDEESSISFNIIPVAGIAFKPTDVKFKAANNVTSSGLMDVYLNSESKENRLLSAKYAKSSSSMTDYPNGADKFETEISSIAAADEEWSLKTYIYTLTNTKSWIFSDVIISGTFTGVEYDGVFFGISASAEPAEGGVVTHVPSALKAQAGKKVTFRASPNEGYKFVKWRDVDNEKEYTTPVTSIESLNSNVSYEAVFEKLPMVTFSMGKVADLTGNVPKAVYVDNEGKLTIPENTTLYKENYALTAWTDGTTEYAVGQEYTFSSDVTLTPVMTACAYNLPDTDAPVTATWYFDQEDGAPVISWSEKTTVFTYTKGVMVNDAKIDVPMVMTGAKADNDDARVNFLKAADGSKAKGGQLNDNLTLKIPAVYGMKITVQASLKVDNIDKDTPNETRFDEGKGEKAAYLWFLENSSDTKTTAAGDSAKTERTFTFTYKGDKKEIWIKVAKAGTTSTYGFYENIEVEYPVLPQVKAANKIISTPLITKWEDSENAGKTEITAPDPNKNTGKRYKPGEKVTLTAKAGYGYYISAFKDGDKELEMTKIAPSAESTEPTRASAEYTVGETTGTVTVEYTRLPMAKVRLETVDGKLGSVDFGSEDIHENFYEMGDGYVESFFVAGKTAIASSDAADDYVLEKWVNATTGTKESDGASFTFNVPSEGGSVTYQAYFTLGKIGSVKFDIASAMEKVKNAETGLDKLVKFTVDAKSTAPADQANCRSFYIPKYHGLFRTYDSAGNEDGWSLKYWVDIKDNSKIYDIGKNYSFANENQEITLIPVFEQNPAGMQNRLNSPVLTYEFGTGPGIRAQRLDLGKGKDTYLCAPVYTEILQNSTDLSHTRDVALWINTGEKGYVRNSGFEEWAAIGPGTTLTVASCAGTKIEILSYAPITSTTIDGVVPMECQQIGEHEYVYSYTTQSPAARIPIVIGDDYGYYKWIKAHTLSANRVQLHTSSVNKEQGEITNTEAVTKDNEREYITKLEDGGYSLIQGTRVKVSFERKFGYVFDKIVDPDKIVDGEPFTVLQMLDKSSVSMVKPDDAKEVEYVEQNEDGTWGGNDKVFLLRVIEPTDEEKRKGQRTRYEVEFEITKHRNLQFYFKEKPTYYITFNPGKEATGIAPTAKWVEEGDEYVIPKNSTLYYSGFTLKRWKSEDGTKIYDIGTTYKAPADNLRLFPEFEANTFSLFDNDLTKESTATWNLTRNDGAPDLAYERSSGILVTQLKKDPDDAESDFIDICIDLNASDREIGENESKTTVHGKFNNMNYDDRCQINMYSILSFPVTKGCEVSMEATSIISTTNIAGATADNGGYTAGKQVTMTWNGAEGTQEVNFQSDGRYYTYFAVTYKPQTIEKPALKSVTISGTELTVEQLTELKKNGSITLDTYPVKLDPVTGKFVEEKMDEVQATASGTGKTEIEQPSLDNPTAVIRLLTSGNMRLNTYTINFTLQPTVSSVEGAENAPQFVRTVINGEEFKSHEVSVENMPASGYIQVEFDRTMKAMELSFKIGGKEMKFSAAQGKKLTFYYWNIPNATLSYTIPKEKFVDIYGVAHAEADFVKIFKTRSTTKELYQKTFDFIVGKDGTLDEAIAAANKDEGTDRYLIFVPDGEYQLTGNESLEGRYNITSDGEWPCDGDGNTVTDDDMKNKYNYKNGMTQVERSKVSIIGQSREGVMIWNKPIVEGIGYTATIHVGGRKMYNEGGMVVGTKRAEDFYAEDISMENRFPYWNSMNGGSGAGRAVVLWDQGQRTTLKNVSMMSWQDTYYSSNAAADYRSYFENCAIGGVVDWICGDGNIWFQQCDIVVRDRSGNNLAAPSQDNIQQWGYVFNECNIVPEFPLSQMEKLKDKTWTLARPWANSPTKSPACTFINTKMSVLPKDQGWGSMGSGAVLRFHENRTMDGGGTVLTLGARSLAACAPAAGSDDCVMNDTEASKYTIENVLGGSDSFTPRERTMQIDAVSGGSDAYDKYNSVPWEDNIETDDDRLTWQPHPNALCYFVFKQENGKWVYKTNITETSISLDQLTLGTGTYCVRAANQYGGLGAPTKAIDYQEVRRYQLTLSQLGDLKVDGVPYGWSTICLPYNARVPEGVKVYAVTAHNKTEEASDVTDYYVTLAETDYLNKDKGYIVYGPAGDYVFKATSREGTKATILRGNPTDYPVSSVNNNCYILANRTYGLGFYKFTGTELKPYRAWLPADKVVSDVNVGLSSGAKGLRFVFSDDADLPTGILDCLYGNPNDTDAEGLYNLSGQRVKTPASRGIYIRRGQGKSVMGE